MVDSYSPSTSTSLRFRVARVHDESTRLARTTAIADAADHSLAQTQGLLERAHSMIHTERAPIDGILSAIDDTTARPRVDGVAVLHEGLTLSSDRGDLDIRPMNTTSLGAVVDSGRSHRLSDLRTGGSLDPRTNPGAALRSTSGAMREVQAMRDQLGNFRDSVLVPAQYQTMTATRTLAGAGPVTDGNAEAARVRHALTGAHGAAALASTNFASVLNLLS
jgi:hypothetical protein